MDMKVKQCIFTGYSYCKNIDFLPFFMCLAFFRQSVVYIILHD